MSQRAMTVADLIAELQSLPQHLHVFVWSDDEDPLPYRVTGAEVEDDKHIGLHVSIGW